jgi:hypothetical protein
MQTFCNHPIKILHATTSSKIATVGAISIVTRPRAETVSPRSLSNTSSGWSLATTDSSIERITAEAGRGMEARFLGQCKHRVVPGSHLCSLYNPRGYNPTQRVENEEIHVHHLFPENQLPQCIPGSPHLPHNALINNKNYRKHTISSSDRRRSALYRAAPVPAHPDDHGRVAGQDELTPVRTESSWPGLSRPSRSWGAVLI